MRFTTQVSLPVARDALFAFHTDADNLRELLAGWTRTRVVTTDGHIRPGARTQVCERWGPFEVQLVFEHFLLEAPERFGERLVRGPFRVFEHVHEFQSDGSATRIEERLEVELPLWLGGEIATRLFVLPRLRRLFEFRRRAYERLAAEGRFASA